MTDHYEARCPSCGGSDEQGCYADCPKDELTRLRSDLEKAKEALRPFAKEEWFWTGNPVDGNSRRCCDYCNGESLTGEWEAKIQHLERCPTLAVHNVLSQLENSK